VSAETVCREVAANFQIEPHTFFQLAIQLQNERVAKRNGRVALVAVGWQRLELGCCHLELMERTRRYANECSFIAGCAVAPAHEVEERTSKGCLARGINDAALLVRVSQQ
jgi:hypothetical protein